MSDDNYRRMLEKENKNHREDLLACAFVAAPFIFLFFGMVVFVSVWQFTADIAEVPRSEASIIPAWIAVVVVLGLLAWRVLEKLAESD